MTEIKSRTITATAGAGDGQVAVPALEVARLRLRQRWELASVLNFLKVFEPVIKSNLKISAEEIEMGLIEPNKSLAQLHIMLLQAASCHTRKPFRIDQIGTEVVAGKTMGIPPASKTLNDSDAWIATLSKKLTMWWPWVAEGDFPLTAAKGEEIARYKELDPTIRVMILKALCEIRADQDDIVSFINDAIKNGELSAFRKNSIGGDGNGTTYWYDGSAVIGHRLYKEVNTFNGKSKVKESRAVPTINSQWETLATDLEEFSRVVDEFSSSQSELEVAVGKAVETEAIPALNRLHKKKERALKQQERQQRLLTGLRTSGITRSCRNRRPITYTFDEYDKAIDEAIRQTKKRKTGEGQKRVGKGTSSSEASDQDSKFRESKSTESDTESDRIEGDDAEDTSSDEYDDERDDNDTDKENKSPGNRKNTELDSPKQTWPKGSRRSKRVAEIAPSPVPEIRKLGAKKRSRQRPNHYTALESAVIPDSEDEGYSSENASQ